MLKNYSAPRRAHTLLVLGLGALAHALVGPLLPGRRTKSGALAALSWNLSRRGSLVEARRAVKRARQLSDRKLASAMIRSRGSQYLGEPSRSQHPGDAGAVDHPGIPTAGAVRETAHAYMQPEIDHVSHLVERLRAGEVRPAPIVTVLVVVALMLLGLRGVLSPPLPVLGDLVPLASGSSLVAHFFLGTGDPGWARELGASPPAGALLGVLSMVLGNSSALALKVVLLGAGAVGAIGTVHILGCLGPSRDDSGSFAAAPGSLAAPPGSLAAPPLAARSASGALLSWRARAVAGVCFLAAPLVWNTIARGDLGAAVALGGFPFLFGRMARAAGLLVPPVASGLSDGPLSFSARALARDAVVIGLLLAVLGSFAPAIAAVTGVVVLCLGIAVLADGRDRLGAVRVLVVAIGAGIVAVVVTLPWALQWMIHGSGWSLLSGAARAPGTVGSPASLLSGHLGPFGGFSGIFGLLVLAGSALLIARGRRLGLVTACWLTSIGVVALAWTGAQGFLGSGWGDSLVLVAPVVTGISLACGLAASGFEDELRRHGIGWRHGLAALASAGLVLGVASGAMAGIGGRAELPQGGFEAYVTAAPAASAASAASQSYRTLWLGDPAALPGASDQLAPGLAALVSKGSLPGEENLWPPVPGRAAAAVGSDLVSAERGTTVELGSMLARWGIRYVVVPSASAPVVSGAPPPAVVAPPPAAVTKVLSSQIDMEQRLTEAGIVTFVNTAWTSKDGAGPVTSGSLPDSGGRLLELAVSLLFLAVLVTAAVLVRRHEAATDPEPGRVPRSVADEV
ncbi:MAG: hypothetical protein ACRDZ5_09260, partial [Acidimicrobiales bacterium]